jgi:peptide/nickel transport system permease protein
LLAVCLLVTLADSVHYRLALSRVADAPMGSVAYDTRTRSVLDAVLADLVNSREVTYSRPMAYVSFTKETVTTAGRAERVAPRLKHGGAHLTDPASQRGLDVAQRAGLGLLKGGLMAVLGAWLLFWLLARHRQSRLLEAAGNDVLYQALKSIRTAFVIGSLATVATLPLAVVLGIMAGYLGGWVDELIQYLYTVLSSVPNVLLIAACVLMVQVFLDKHPELFETAVERSDLKLFLLCTVLGLTGWAGLCRLLRGETLKLRELEYVQAANAFGVSHTRIMLRHIFPNVAHLMLIVTVLEFSSLILYEAVLSYVGVGVDPSMNSFGGMINLARKEMSREPMVWWSFVAAFGFMVTVVLAANLFADGVRDAFDPRARHFRPRLAIRPPAKRLP